MALPGYGLGGGPRPFNNNYFSGSFPAMGGFNMANAMTPGAGPGNPAAQLGPPKASGATTGDIQQAAQQEGIKLSWDKIAAFRREASRALLNAQLMSFTGPCALAKQGLDRVAGSLMVPCASLPGAYRSAHAAPLGGPLGKQANMASVPSRMLSRMIPTTDRRGLDEDEMKDIDEGESRWLPKLFQNAGTPVHELMSSPLKGGLLAGGLGAAGGGGLGAVLGSMLGHKSEGALIGAGLGGVLMGGHEAYRRHEKNEELAESMHRMPKGATKQDLEGYHALLQTAGSRFGAKYASDDWMDKLAFSWGGLGRGLGSGAMAVLNPLGKVVSRAGKGILGAGTAIGGGLGYLGGKAVEGLGGGEGAAAFANSMGQSAKAGLKDVGGAFDPSQDSYQSHVMDNGQQQLASTGAPDWMKTTHKMGVGAGQAAAGGLGVAGAGSLLSAAGKAAQTANLARTANVAHKGLHLATGGHIGTGMDVAMQAAAPLLKTAGNAVQKAAPVVAGMSALHAATSPQPGQAPQAPQASVPHVDPMKGRDYLANYRPTMGSTSKSPVPGTQVTPQATMPRLAPPTPKPPVPQPPAPMAQQPPAPAQAPTQPEQPEQPYVMRTTQEAPGGGGAAVSMSGEFPTMGSASGRHAASRQHWIDYNAQYQQPKPYFQPPTQDTSYRQPTALPDAEGNEGLQRAQAGMMSRGYQYGPQGWYKPASDRFSNPVYGEPSEDEARHYPAAIDRALQHQDSDRESYEHEIALLMGKHQSNKQADDHVNTGLPGLIQRAGGLLGMGAGGAMGLGGAAELLHNDNALNAAGKAGGRLADRLGNWGARQWFGGEFRNQMRGLDMLPKMLSGQSTQGDLMKLRLQQLMSGFRKGTGSAAMRLADSPVLPAMGKGLAGLGAAALPLLGGFIGHSVGSLPGAALGHVAGTVHSKQAGDATKLLDMDPGARAASLLGLGQQNRGLGQQNQGLGQQNQGTGYEVKTAGVAHAFTVPAYSTPPATPQRSAYGVFDPIAQLAKQAAQDNSRPSRSALGDDHGITVSYKSDDYDKGPAAWANSAKYLKRGKRDGRPPVGGGFKKHAGNNLTYGESHQDFTEDGRPAGGVLTDEEQDITLGGESMGDSNQTKTAALTCRKPLGQSSVPMPASGASVLRPLQSQNTQPADSQTGIGKVGGELTPFAQGFFARCIEAGMDADQIKQAVDRVAFEFGAKASSELRDGMTKLAFNWASAIKPAYKAIAPKLTGAFQAAKPALSKTWDYAARPAVQGALGAYTGSQAAPEGYEGTGAVMGGVAGLAGGSHWGHNWLKSGTGAAKALAQSYGGAPRGMIAGSMVDQVGSAAGFDTGNAGARWGSRLGLASPLLDKATGGKFTKDINSFNDASMNPKAWLGMGKDKSLAANLGGKAGMLGMVGLPVGSAIASHQMQQRAPEIFENQIRQMTGGQMGAQEAGKLLMAGAQGGQMHQLLGPVSQMADQLLSSMGMDPSTMHPMQKLLILGGGATALGGALSGHNGVAGAGALAAGAGIAPQLMHGMHSGLTAPMAGTRPQTSVVWDQYQPKSPV